jgi:homoserine kinase
MSAVSILVPASTSNLGAGFDCVGVALGLWLRVEASRLDAGAGALELRRSGTLAALDVPTGDDRIVRGFQSACESAGAGRVGVVLEAHSSIPIGRGLGSSAAATVAGALAARALLGLDLDDAAVLDLCAAIEGHADNVAPILFGGATLVTRGAGGLLVTPLDVHEGLAFVIAVPPFAVQTDSARSILPASVSHGTAATAASHAAALVHGLAHADGALLGVALDDVLHVPFRRRLVAGYERVTAAARAAGAFGATLSGSGSSILAITPVPAASRVGEAMAGAWRDAGVIADIIHPEVVVGAAPCGRP